MKATLTCNTCGEDVSDTKWTHECKHDTLLEHIWKTGHHTRDSMNCEECLDKVARASKDKVVENSATDTSY